MTFTIPGEEPVGYTWRAENYPADRIIEAMESSDLRFPNWYDFPTVEGKVRQLAQLCAEYTGNVASLGVAESTINAAALAAQAMPAKTDFHQLWDRHGVDGESYDVAQQWFALGQQSAPQAS